MNELLRIAAAILILQVWYVLLYFTGWWRPSDLRGAIDEKAWRDAEQRYHDHWMKRRYPVLRIPLDDLREVEERAADDWYSR